MTEINLNFNYIPLTFLSSNEEIKRQIKNTIIMKYVLNNFKKPKKLVEHLIDTRYGYTDSAKEEGTHKFLRISDIKDGQVDWDSVPYCNCSNYSGYLLEKGDILVARTGGTTGKSFLITQPRFPSVYASYLIRLRTSKNLKPEFLDIFLNSFVYWNQIVELKQGSAQPNVNAEKLKGLIIPYCDIDMQENLLQLVDSEYHNENPQLIKISEEIEFIIRKFQETEKLKVLFYNQEIQSSHLRQSILQEAVQGKLIQQDPNHEPSSILLKKIKTKKEQMIREKIIKKEKPLLEITEGEIPYELPQGWEWIRLGELANFIDYRGKTPVKTASGIPLITAKNVKMGFISVNPREYIAELDYSKWMTRRIPEYGDVIFTTEAPLGNVAQLNIEGIFALAQRTITFKIYTGYYSTFLKYVLMSNSIKESICKKATGTTALGIKASKLKGVILPLPPLNEQKRIIEKVDQLMALCNELERTVEQSKRESEMLMQALLQEVFRSDYGGIKSGRDKI